MCLITCFESARMCQLAVSAPPFEFHLQVRLRLRRTDAPCSVRVCEERSSWAIGGGMEESGSHLLCFCFLCAVPLGINLQGE